MPRLHPRYHDVKNADIALATFIDGLAEKCNLTDTELIDLLAKQVAKWTHLAVRIERHGDVTKPADEA